MAIPTHKEIVDAANNDVMQTNFILDLETELTPLEKLTIIKICAQVSMLFLVVTTPQAHRALIKCLRSDMKNFEEMIDKLTNTKEKL